MQITILQTWIPVNYISSLNVFLDPYNVEIDTKITIFGRLIVEI